MGIWRSAVIAASISTSMTALVLGSTVASAAEVERHSYHLPSQPLAVSLRAVAIASGRSIVAPADLVNGKRAPSLDGDFTPEEAIAALLVGSGLRQRAVGTGLIIEQEAAAQDVSAEANGSDIVVTGSRIRGAPVASPVIRLDQEAMRDAGQTSLADVARSIPQSFGGGQNPGVGANVGSANGINVGGAATINLRGLGSDATLTLLNGHRLAYNGSRQGIDVSAIPLGAVDRLEIVADGASALYGSDAVAGVANIILRRDYDGVRVEAEGGLATEGGYSRQRYGMTAGTRWRSGGIIASYEFARSTDLLSDERSFARTRPGVIIFPPLERHAIVLSGHQALTDSLTFEADLLFNRRKTEIGFPDNPAGDLSVSHTEQPSTSRSFAVAPALKLDLAGSWRIALSGVYGNERVFSRANNFVGQALIRSTPLCYCNDGKSAELAADGNLFALPGGMARIAIGTGYRTNSLNADRGPGNVANVRRSQDSYYGYGELSLPLVSPELEIPAIERLNLSAALRYERYPGVDDVATPKVGLIYAPASWVDLKASWGRSFRAPTLLQQYQVPAVILYPVRTLGGSGYPAAATALIISGGNPALQPERASTWSTSIDLHPAALEGARLQLGYFSIRYADRIVTPISPTAQSLSNPAYAGLVTLDPGSAAAAAAIASSPQFINSSGTAVNPATVVAIVDNRNRNAGRQSIHGFDILADYRFRLGGGELTATLNASYLHIDQQLGAGQPVLARSGVLFTPPDWRGRAGLTWNGGSLTLNGTVSYIDGVDDSRTASTVRVHGMTTLDLTARYRLAQASGPLRGVELTVSALNAFDARPAAIASSSYIDSTYDSTNYSPLGRVISFGIAKSW